MERNILEKSMFKDLSESMSILAVLPHSSAAAERLFSIMNVVKNPKRNILSVKTVESILYAKQLHINSGLKIFEPSLELLKYRENFKFVDGKHLSL